MKRECESCIRRKTTYCPSSMECMNTNDMPYYQNRIMLLEENEQLKGDWNKLKEYIRKNIIYDDVGMKILDPSPLEDYIQELEQGSDSNERRFNNNGC